MVNLKDLTIEQLNELIVSLGEKSFRTKQVYSWLYKGVTSFDEMTDISKSLREKLSNVSFISAPKIVKRLESKIDGTNNIFLNLQTEMW